MSSITDIQKDINNSRSCNKSTIDHYSILLDYIITDDYDFSADHEKLDVEKVLFDWYKKYDPSVDSQYESVLLQLINSDQTVFQLKDFLPLDLNHYIFLRVIKYYQLYHNQIEKFEIIFEMILDTYNIDLKARTTLLSGLIQPFIEYTKVDKDADKVINLFEFIEPKNVESILLRILSLVLYSSQNEYNNKSSYNLVHGVLQPFLRYNFDYHSKLIPLIHKTSLTFLAANVSSVNYSFVQNLLSLLLEGTEIVQKNEIVTFITENMDIVPFTLYEINEFYNMFGQDSFDFKFFNKNLSLHVFKADFLSILNLLKTKNIVMVHQFLKRGSVQIEQFNQLLTENPDFIKKNQHLVLEKFNRIPEKYILKKLINIHDSEDTDTSLFSKDLVDEKFWDNFNQANTCSKTNKYLKICYDVALQLSDYHVELINILHMFPVHFRPNRLFGISLEELTFTLIVESKLNVIESFNIIKKTLEILHSISRKPLGHLQFSDEAILIMCQSTYINEIDDSENIEYLESSIFDFVNLLSEFEELKYKFYDTKKYETLWLRVVHFVKENDDDDTFFKVLLLLPIDFEESNPTVPRYIKNLLTY